MSLYSHGRERIRARIGFPFCRVETRIDEGPERVRTCGVGCLIFGALELVVVEGDGRDAAGGTAGAAVVGTCSACSRAEKSMSGPKSSSMVVCTSKD